VREVFGLTTLAAAAYYGREAVAKRLLEDGVVLDPETSVPTSSSSDITSHIPFSKSPLPENMVYYRPTLTPLALAAEAGHLNVVKLLISSGADIDARKSGYVSPLQAASMNNHLDVVEYLLASGADPNRNYIFRELGAAIAAAVFNQNNDLLALLLRHNASPNAISRKQIVGWDHYISGLGWACWRGNMDAVRLLLEHGADIEYLGRPDEFEPVPDDWTPAQVAQDCGHHQIVDLLVLRGSPKPVKNPEGELDELYYQSNFEVRIKF